MDDPGGEVMRGERRRIGATALAYLPAVAFALFALLMMTRRVAGGPIWSDEQLFLGGAGLMARGEGLVYHDFFYNHMPLLALITSVVFRAVSHWALAARMIDAGSGAAIAGLLFEVTRRSLAGLPAALRLAAAAAVGAIFVFNPIVANACGVAWNHSFAGLMCVSAFLLLAHGLGRPRPMGWAVAAGVCAAAAATTRLTFAPPMAAFPVLILLAPGRPFGARIRLVVAWALGAFVGALPSLYLILHAPAAAYFENIKFPKLSARFAEDTKANTRLDAAGKVQYAWWTAKGSHAIQCLLALLIVAIAVALRPIAAARRSLSDARFIGCLLLFAAALATAFVPTPMYQQYLYAPVPFAVLAVALALGRLNLRSQRWAAIALVPIAAWCVIDGWHSYPPIGLLARPNAWTPNQWHADARKLAARVPSGKVLTLWPGLAMEAGLPIYRELSVGRYAARSADRLSAKQRAQFHVPDRAAMKAWFESDPPAAVLLDQPRKTKLEKTIASLARQHGYAPQAFTSYPIKRTLWLPATRPTTAPTTR